MTPSRKNVNNMVNMRKGIKSPMKNFKGTYRLPIRANIVSMVPFCPKLGRYAWIF